MANEEQLSILKQGVKVWNEWRNENSDVHVDLRRANLRGADLQRVYLRGADLRGADFRGANLRQADLNARLGEANLSGANLIEAQVSDADVSEADLRGADLSEAVLYATNFWAAELSRTKFSFAHVGANDFGNLDLREAIGLDRVLHHGPSTIGTDTIAKSKGKIPEVFLQGCGLSDADIEYAKLANPDLNNEAINKILYTMYDLLATQALQVSALFVSYNHADKEFVDKITAGLTKRGIRYWRDIYEMKAGRMEKQIDKAIRQNPTVLLVLSEHSLSSDWVEYEVHTAREIEKELGRDVLCPVALDDSWKSSRWPQRVMEQIMEYNILDFSDWEDDRKFDEMFRRLIDGLELFYKG